MSDYTQEALLALELARVRAERDALAAHVGRIHALANVANLLGADDVCNQLVAIDDESPATSLAKLKAQWQAEALESLGHHFMIGDSHKSFILQKAHELRRQAEEPENQAKHEWDWETGAGERCVKCGDKDWFAGPVCSESKLRRQAEEKHDEAR